MLLKKKKGKNTQNKKERLEIKSKIEVMTNSVECLEDKMKKPAIEQSQRSLKRGEERQENSRITRSPTSQ